MDGSQVTVETRGDATPSVTTPEPAAGAAGVVLRDTPAMHPVSWSEVKPEEQAQRRALPDNRNSSRTGRRMAAWTFAWLKRLATLAVVLIAVAAALVMWDYYV
ncbi:MAG: hypothetical protein JO001_07555, partial [Alphaproteobacteria bacterium]|nr:hypothetical protein [Alphaproteobacteria bacterium]